MSAPAWRRPPPRRLPARVYWVRRLLVLGVLGALVWTVTSAFGGEAPPTDSADPASPAADPTSEPVPATTEPPKQRLPGRNGDDERPRVVTAALPPSDGGCLAEDVRVVPNVAAATSGSEVTIDLVLGTTGTAACRLEIDADMLLLTVTTGGSNVWSTDQCTAAVPERTVVLRPGWAAALSVSWPGRYGDNGCTGATRPASPGSYAVEAALYGGEPSRADFQLHAPDRHDQT